MACDLTPTEIVRRLELVSYGIYGDKETARHAIKLIQSLQAENADLRRQLDATQKLIVHNAQMHEDVGEY